MLNSIFCLSSFRFVLMFSNMLISLNELILMDFGLCFRFVYALGSLDQMLLTSVAIVPPLEVDAGWVHGLQGE